MDQRQRPSVCPHAVGVSLCDAAPLLWRMEDLRSVRARGLVGALLGSLARTPRQNLRLGRPLLLLPEEERLLSEEHAAAALPAHHQVSLTERERQVSGRGAELGPTAAVLVTGRGSSAEGEAVRGGAAEEL